MSVSAPLPAPASPAAPAATGPVVEVLLDDDDLRIELHRLQPASDTVALTFDPIMWRMDMRPFGVDFLLKSGVDTIAVRKKREHFYQVLPRERLQALVAPVLQRYRRRLAYGSSLGAYAVLYYCAHGYDMVISSSPRVSVHPQHGIPHWQRQVRFLHERFGAQPPATSPAVVFYDPKDVQDQRFVEHEVQPSWPHAQYVRIPYAGHPSNQFLAEIGYITVCIRALIQGQPLPPLDRRAKGRSGMYHQVLAHACLERGKLRWALALGERAMQLSPYLDLGRRTLAEIHLARGELDACQAHLDWFLDRHPQDGPGLAALQALQRRRSGAPQAGGSSAPGAAAEGSGSAADALALADAAAVRRANTPWQRLLRRTRAWLTSSADGSPTLAQRLHRRWHAAAPEGRGGVTRDDVAWAYRQFLGRPPESDAAIAGHLRSSSQRALVQSFLDSAEYQRRQQRAAGAAATPGSTVRKGAYRRNGPVVLVLGNCQAPGVASVIAASCGVAEVVPLTSLNLSEDAQRAQLRAQAARADVWLVNPASKIAREVFAEGARSGAQLLSVPALHFNAFHPDVCYAQHRGRQQLTNQHYNSAIVAWAYGQGLPAEQAAALFHGDTYRALGYLDAWHTAVNGLRKSFAASDLAPDFDTWLLRVQRLGCFMHTPNHPHLAAVALLARMAARRAGIEVLDEPAPGELVDGLASTVWPVYPEIAQALALDTGSLTWKFVTRNDYLRGADAYVRHAYAAYRAQEIAPADLEIRWADTTALDRVLRERAGLPPR